MDKTDAGEGLPSHASQPTGILSLTFITLARERIALAVADLSQPPKPAEWQRLERI
jgi:hypothetical protein